LLKPDMILGAGLLSSETIVL